MFVILTDRVQLTEMVKGLDSVFMSCGWKVAVRNIIEWIQESYQILQATWNFTSMPLASFHTLLGVFIRSMPKFLFLIV